jgi:hypothetical protein
MIEAGLALCHDPFGFAQGRIFDCEPQNWRLCAQDDGLALTAGGRRNRSAETHPRKNSTLKNREWGTRVGHFEQSWSR